MSNVVLAAKYYGDTDIKNFSKHYHDCHELIYVKNGEVDFRIDKNVYRAKSGSLLVINRFEEHSTNIISSDYGRISLRIVPTIDPVEDHYLAHLFQIVVNRPENFSHLIEINQNRDVAEHILMELCRENENKDSYSENMCNLLFKQLLICILRNNSTPLDTDKDKNIDLINNVKRLFETEYDKEHSLNSVSQKYHISPYYLSHIFKSVTGCSVMNYLTFCRIAQAKKLLTKTNLPINEIVSKCGFSDTSNFGRLFKKTTGLSAKDFRNKYRI